MFQRLILLRPGSLAPPRPLRRAAVLGCALAAAPVSSAAAADHTLHMIAHVAPRCTVHRATPHVALAFALDGAGAPHPHRGLRGDGGFRIACNVPYAFDFRFVRRHGSVGRLTPLAALPPAHIPAVIDGAHHPFDLTVSLPGRDGPLEGRCRASELSPDAEACTPISAPDDPRLGLPRGDVRLALIAADAGSDAGAVATDAPVLAVAASAASAEAPAQGPSRLHVVVLPRH